MTQCFTTEAIMHKLREVCLLSGQPLIENRP